MSGLPTWDIVHGAGPVVACATHHGDVVRPELQAQLALTPGERKREEDPFTGELARRVPTRIVVQRSRFEVDLNRPREGAVYRSPADAWGLAVWQVPPEGGVLARSLALYDRFYADLDGVLAAKAALHGGFVLLDIHSYNHRRIGPDGPPEDAQKNPVVNLGTGNIDRDHWARVVEAFARSMERGPAQGPLLDVRENVRFRGGHLSRWVTQRFARRGCVLAIEFKKIFMDEWTGQVDSAALTMLGDRLEASLPHVAAALAVTLSAS